MSFQDVVDAWATELQATVAGLSTTLVPAARLHKYTPWAVEDLMGSSGERHLAIWPQGEPEVVQRATAAGRPSDIALSTYLIRVWEDASTDTSRIHDDEVAGLAWIQLGEAIRDRLYDADNFQRGGVDATFYDGMAFDLRAGKRILEVRFKVRVWHTAV